jgi:hypothetical protein
MQNSDAVTRNIREQRITAAIRVFIKIISG